MRIAIVAHGLSDGGAERVAALVANYYSKRGHDVLFLAVYSPNKVYRLDSAVKYMYINAQYTDKIRKFLCRSYQINREIKRFKANVAVSFIRNESIYSSIFKTVPFIYSLRIDPEHACGTLIDKITCYLAFSVASKVVFQTPAARDFFPKKIREKGVVIANPLTRNLPYWDSQNCEKAVITACRLTEQKNLPMLISAFAAFHEKHPEYSLKIYGDGELLEDLKAFAKECGVEESVFFPGYAKNIHEIMAHSAIFALTSDYEGLSNSMLEALAIGVPTVCTDCPPGGAALYIKDGINGMLVPVGDRMELSKRLCRLAEDKELCLRMSEESRKIREELDIDRVLKQWENILESGTAGARRPV